MNQRATTVAALALVMALTPIARARQEARSGQGSITGQVVFEGGEAPLVYAVYVVLADDSADAAGSTEIRADESGKFTSPPLAPGLYTVYATAPGYRCVSDDGAYNRPGDAVTVTMRKAGVVTGTVTDEAGEPIGAVGVQALKVKDEWGRPLARPETSGQDQLTDDRGIYRIYNLGPGTYIVAAGRAEFSNFDEIVLPHGRDPYVFYPSSGRRDAAEVKIGWGEERGGIDIRFVRRHGATVTGTVVGRIPEGGEARVALYRSDGSTEAESYLDPKGSDVPFELRAIPDGDYEIVAEGLDEDYETVSRTSRRIAVRNDVRGVRLALAPSPSSEIRGRVTLDPADPKWPDTCRAPAPSVAEVGLIGHPPDATNTAPFGAEPVYQWVTSPSASGEVKMEKVVPSVYRLSVNLPADDLYIKGVSRGPKGDPSLCELALASGQKVNDLVVAIGRGAASVSGTVATEKDVIVFLVPVDAALATNPWRYGEAWIREDGTFDVRHLAPGKYWVLARLAPDEDEETPLRDKAELAALRADAEAAKHEIELSSCQTLRDVAVEVRPSTTAAR